MQARLSRLSDQLRFEEATAVRRRLETLTQTGRRFHRVRSLASCPQIVAARRSGDDWEIHVIRYGRLAAAARSSPAEVPQAVARAAVATAETVQPPIASLPTAGIEETERIADWLEQPGVRLIEITGEWMWPLHGVLDHEALVRHAGRPPGSPSPEPTSAVVSGRSPIGSGPGPVPARSVLAVGAG
jgi:DNA polymerase-3 subunit epsilon